MEITNKMQELTTALEELSKTKAWLETAELQCTEIEAELVAVQEKMNSWESHLSETCNIMQCEKLQLMQEGELWHYRAIKEERNKWEAHKARLAKEISKLKSRLEISTDSGVVITSDLDQPSHDL